MVAAVRGRLGRAGGSRGVWGCDPTLPGPVTVVGTRGGSHVGQRPHDAQCQEWTAAHRIITRCPCSRATPMRGANKRGAGAGGGEVQKSGFMGALCSAQFFYKGKTAQKRKKERKNLKKPVNKQKKRFLHFTWTLPSRTNTTWQRGGG